MEPNQTMKFSSARKMAFATVLMSAVIAVMAVAWNTGKIALAGKSSQAEGKGRILERVRKSPDISVLTGNADGSPLFIRDAGVKEISGEEYQLLTGNKSDSGRQVSYPNVEIVNNSGKVVTTLIVCFQAGDSVRRRCHMVHDFSWQPAASLSIESWKWIIPTVRLRQTGNKFEEDKSRPDLDRAEMWQQGRATDFVVYVGKIDFADGSSWINPSR